MPSSKTYKCGSCTLVIAKTSTSVMCKSCNLWFHVHCVNVSEDTLKVLKEIKSIVFLCDKCGSNPTLGLHEMEKRLRDEIVGIDRKIESYMQRKEDDFDNLKRSFTEAIHDFKLEMSSYRKELQSDIISSSKLIRKVDVSTIVVGLPAGLEDLLAVVIKICSHYGVNVSRNDINHVCYMHNRKAMLPAAAKLNLMCRRLLRLKIISKFKILNTDKVKAKLTLSDVDIVTYNTNECTALLNSNVAAE
ncbi:hypothetical protein CVS40_6354 [Lucilia cuprina]|nr:hypothetical protein CVS40_6354 [Lucilia cuprina]